MGVGILESRRYLFKGCPWVIERDGITAGRSIDVVHAAEVVVYMVVCTVIRPRAAKICPTATDLKSRVVSLKKIEYVVCCGVDDLHEFGELRVLVEILRSLKRLLCGCGIDEILEMLFEFTVEPCRKRFLQFTPPNQRWEKTKRIGLREHCFFHSC